MSSPSLSDLRDGRCGVQQPSNKRRCYRAAGHDGEHRSVLTPGSTYCYWEKPNGPVDYRVQTAEDKREIRLSGRIEEVDE